jgi:sulfide:quinone oxidoreductase
MAVRIGHATIDGLMTSTRNPKQVLIAGAGVAALEAALALQALTEDEVSVELVAPEAEFTYRPLAVTEPFRVGEVKRFPLQKLAGAAGARLRTGSVTAVNPERKVVTLENGQELSYDILLLALGARPREAVTGALTFRGPQDGPALSALLDKTTAGEIHRIAFAVPTGASWPLPLYELAILTADYMTAHGTRGVEIVFVTPEDHPLALFGPTASDAVSELLTSREIQVETSVTPIRFEAGALSIVTERPIAVDAVVALPRLEGPRLPGVPHDDHGFVPTDEYGWVLGLTDVYAAGDLTQFPLKQGGIATQQADAAASSIAADAGATVKPEPFRPVLRGLLITGFVPRFLRAEATGADSVVDTEPLWWPPAKIVGRYLTPFLAAKLGLGETVVGPLREGAIPIEVEFETGGRPAWTRV